MPFYANTHTDSSLTGRVTSSLREQAKQMVRKACGASQEEHAVIFAGSGSTAAIALLARLLCNHTTQGSKGKVHIPFFKKTNLKEMDKTTIAVLVGPYEHHSNILIWKEAGAHVVTIALNDEGHMDLGDMEKRLKKLHKKRCMIIGSISAGSNVTGENDFQECDHGSPLW